MEVETVRLADLCDLMAEPAKPGSRPEALYLARMSASDLARISIGKARLSTGNALFGSQTLGLGAACPHRWAGRLQTYEAWPQPSNPTMSCMASFALTWTRLYSLEAGVCTTAVFCIDEPEAHLNARLQSQLLSVLYDLTPE